MSSPKRLKQFQLNTYLLCPLLPLPTISGRQQLSIQTRIHPVVDQFYRGLWQAIHRKMCHIALWLFRSAFQLAFQLWAWRYLPRSQSPCKPFTKTTPPWSKLALYAVSFLNLILGMADSLTWKSRRHCHRGVTVACFHWWPDSVEKNLCAGR